MNANNIWSNVAMLPKKLLTAGLILLGGVTAILALNWNATEALSQSGRRSELGIARKGAAGNTLKFRGAKGKHSKKGKHGERHRELSTSNR